MPDIAEICLELPGLYEAMVTITAPGVRGYHCNPTTAHGGPTESAQERAWRARETLENDLTDLGEAAAILADDPGLENAPITRIAATLAGHAAALAAWPEMRDTVTKIHGRWERRANPQTENTQLLCPSCGTTTLRQRRSDRVLECPACHYTATLEQAQAMRRHILRTANTWISRDMAASLFGLTREALRQHIHRGNLHLREGLLSTSELRGLDRR